MRARRFVSRGTLPHLSGVVSESGLPCVRLLPRREPFPKITGMTRSAMKGAMRTPIDTGEIAEIVVVVVAIEVMDVMSWRDRTACIQPDLAMQACGSLTNRR